MQKENDWDDTIEAKEVEMREPLVYTNVEARAEWAKYLHAVTLEFDDVETCKNFSKAEII